MSFPLQVLRQTRRNMLRLCDSLTLEQLNLIPAEMNNNLLWNVGHVIATQQLLCYGLGNQPIPLPADFIERYRKGSRPTAAASGAEWTYIKSRLESTVDEFENDLRSLDFSNFREYETSYGTKLLNIGQALSFNNVHEGMHLGNMIVMRKMV
ncbi:hypothetical protein CEQ90_12530 [Lewinellaceae bacterium SD302]|nr:hypothetical protein CEQ90_12530 [Lewinellaceae bacterium SD302]